MPASPSSVEQRLPALGTYLRKLPGLAGKGSPAIEARISTLETHLEREHPLLLDVVKSFRKLDRVAYRLGILSREESFATRIPWWPLVAVLGTFSSGKSSFINYLLQTRLQTSGNQAVDDKFTVICFGADDPPRTLPGLALDADPRFPFYQVSRDIESVAEGEGRRIDAYLQLKTCRSEALRGKILVDSPGFDADEQRNATLRITDHIIDLSDLVLVFFDARHPEPGAMQDTLRHLVGNTIHRPDSSKFLYILNQIDNAAREDNPEEVFAAWQRALAQAGLTAGRFYRIYNPDVAPPIDDPQLRQRFEAKREEDVAEIHGRIHQVEIERAYRVVGVLEKTAKAIEDRVVPAVEAAKASWKRAVLWGDAAVFGTLLVAFAAWTIPAGWWEGLRFSAPWFAPVSSTPWLMALAIVLVAAGAGYLHFLVRKLSARFVARRIARDPNLPDDARAWAVRAFDHGTKAWRPVMAGSPAGWGRGARRRIKEVVADADRFVQRLNDRFADPSGGAGADAGPDEARPEAVESKPDGGASRKLDGGASRTDPPPAAVGAGPSPSAGG